MPIRGRFSRIAEGADVCAIEGVTASRADQRRRGVREALPPLDRRSGGILGGNGARRAAWFRRFKKVLDWKLPYTRGSTAAQLNVSENCLDRHLTTARRTRPRIDLGGRAGRRARRSRTASCTREVVRAPTRSKALGVEAGDRVAIYMGMVPEAAVAMLACARIGAHAHGRLRRLHGRGAARSHQRLRGQGAHHRRTAAGAAASRPAEGERRRGARADADASRRSSSLRRTGRPRVADEGGPRRLVGRRSIAASGAADVRAGRARRRAPALHPLHLGHRPGSPRASCTRPAGYLVGAHVTTKYVFDLRDDDIYWCTADVGWVTGHSYIVYGPLSNGATVRDVRGRAELSRRDRFWRIIERHGVTILYTAPTAIRAFMRWGDEWPKKHDLSSLRLLGTRRRADQPRGVDLVPQSHRRRPLPDRRHVVADRDRRDHDHAAARRDARPSRARARCRSSASTPQVVTKDGSDRAPPNEGGLLVIKQPVAVDAAHASGATTSATEKQYWSEVAGRATSPATARAATRTATSGSSAASTTCSTSPATASARPRSRARSSRIRRSPRRRRSAGPTS